MLEDALTDLGLALLSNDMFLLELQVTTHLSLV